MGMGRRLATLVVAPLGALLLGCPDPGTDNTPTINLGAVIDRSALNAEPSWSDVVKLAEAQMNAALQQSNVNLRFEYTIRDSANTPSVAVAQSLDLVTSLKAKGLVLDTSQNDIAVNRTFYDADTGNDLGVPLQCGSCTGGTINNPTNADPDLITREALRNTQRWNFRSIMSTKLIAKVIVTLLMRTNNGDVNGDGRFKISFYGSNEAFGKGAKADTDAAVRTALGCPVAPNPCPNFIIEDVYHPQDADPNSYAWANDVALLTDTGNVVTGGTDGLPDAIVVANFALQQAAFTKAYKATGTSVRSMRYQSFRLTSALRVVQGIAEGEEGVSHINLEKSASGDVLAADYEAAFGARIVYRDSIYYDAAVTMMLGALKAALGLSDPTQVTGAQVAEGLRGINDPVGAVVRTGADEFAAAIGHIRQGQPINYEGASGPMDYDANQNVLDRLVHYKVQGAEFVDVETFDCVSSANCPSVSQ